MIKTIIFDLGAVLIDWNPRYLFTKLFATDAEADHFLSTICTPDWNEEQDGGRSIDEANKFLISQFPEHEEMILAFYDRWEEMLNGPIEATVEIFRELKNSGKYKIYALTNWSAETFPKALKLYDFLSWFDGIVVSGDEKMRKPDPAFFNLLLDRYHVKAENALFIDDNLRNVLAARKMGIDSIHFTSAQQLQEELLERGI